MSSYRQPMRSALKEAFHEQVKNLFLRAVNGGGLEGFTVGLANLRTYYEGALEAIEAPVPSKEGALC